MTVESTLPETRVLLVDDDRDDAFLTQDLLQNIETGRYRVVWAGSYDRAKRELEERSFDVALVDYRIDQRTGLEFIAEVGPNFPNCPMILLTGLRNADIDLAAQRAGAADYLVKDSLSEELLDRSIRYARQHAQRWALLDTVLTNAAAGMISLSATGVPVVWNKRALQALDLDERINGGVTGEMVRGALQDLARGGSLPEEFSSRQNRSFELSVSPAADGGRIVVFHDITRRTEAEQLLRQAAIEADTANRAKSNFLATMSHELRTPLNGILGMVRVLEGTPLDETQFSHLGIIKGSSESLLSIINDILDLSKIEAGRMELEECEFQIASLMDDVLKLLAPNAFAKGVELAGILDPGLVRAMRGDPLRLQQILINITGNAIKFTPVGSVTILAEMVKVKGKSMLRFSVIDTGIGIPPEKAQQLFKKFSQLDASTTRTYGGTGLGLALCKELTHLMGGSIWHEAGARTGSCFRFTVPLNEEHEAIELTRRSVLQSMSGTMIMLVSTNAAIITAFEAFVGSIGGSLAHQPTTRDAIRAMAGSNCAMVIYDRTTESIDPQIVARQLRQAQARSVPTLLLLDGYPGSSSDAKAAFDDILPRPLGWHAYEIVVRRLKHSLQKKARPEMRAASPPRDGRLQILMAEDNEPNHRVASALLRAAGHSLEIAGNGKEAVDMAITGRFDVILMDVNMPVMDGLEATRRIRCHSIGAKTPIIGLTANAMKEDRQKCIEAGMIDYLAKPIDWDRLLSLLSKLQSEIAKAANQVA